MKSKKYSITFRPKGTKSLFVHKEYDTKAEAKQKVRQILEKPLNKRKITNPRVSKNPFYKK